MQQQIGSEGGWVLRSGRGQLRETRSTSSHWQIYLPQTAPTKDLSILQHGIHVIEIKHCEDTRPQNQLSATQEQHEGLCSIFRGASAILLTVLWGVGVTIYNNHTPEPFKEQGLNSQRAKKLASKLHVSFCQLRCQTCPYQTRILLLKCEYY